MFSLAHADDLIARTSDVLYDYLKPGPLELENVADGDMARLTVTGVAPLPPGVSRLAADALTQLRAVLEHTLFAEVAYRLKRPLTKDEARCIEMPATTTADNFAKWIKSHRRPQLAPLRDGETLCEHIRELQPFHQANPDGHPLRVLAEHTNLSKHRTPSVAATLLGAVKPDIPAPDLIVTSGADRPIEVGDVLATGPIDLRVPLSVWPKVSIQRPHTETWHVLIHELGELELWVRSVAVPHLITGSSNVPSLPPQLDTKVGYHDIQIALSTASETPAAKRALYRMQADILRNGL